MIGIYDDDDNRLAMDYASRITVNDGTYPVEAISFAPRWDAVTEPRAQEDGMEAYDPRRMSLLLQVDGMVLADSVAELHDRVDALNAAFDPVLATQSDTSEFDQGFLPFDFSVPTADTDNYPTGLKPMRLYLRAVQLPVPRLSKFEGNGIPYSLVLQAVDPRRYAQTLTAAALPAGATVIDNSLATYRSWPVVTIDLTGAGSTIFSIDSLSDARDPLVLNLNALAGQQVQVDMRSKLITVNGEHDMSPFVSGEYFPLEPEAQTLNVANATNATVTIEWRRAFA